MERDTGFEVDTGNTSWQDDLGNAYAGSFTDPAAAPPVDSSPAPAAGSGWNIEGILKGGADKAVSVYKSYQDYRGVARTAAATEASARVNADLERARLDASRTAAQRQLAVDNAIANLQSQAKLAAARVGSFLQSPAGIATVAIGGAVLWKVLLASR